MALPFASKLQCVLGTLVDAYFRGYDCITVEDCVATTSPPGALESVLYNAGGVSTPASIHVESCSIDINVDIRIDIDLTIDRAMGS